MLGVILLTTKMLSAIGLIVVAPLNEHFTSMTSLVKKGCYYMITILHRLSIYI
jgi:hypothetical protein